ncbi:MAG: hypothetical protein LBG65_08150 [Puniceicoccales bacterium]|nr:hypothetical protein [Puniceicoccales bacterium]
MTKNSACLFAAFAIFSTIAVDDAMADAAGMAPPTASKVQDEFSRLIQEARNAGNAENFKEMKKLLEKAKKIDPKSPEPFRLELAVHLSQEDWPTVRKTLAEYVKRGGILDEFMAIILSTMNPLDGKYLESIEMLTKAIESGTDENRVTSLLRVRMGMYTEIGKRAEGRADLQRLSKRNGLSFDLLELSAKLELLEGNARNALEFLEKAMKMREGAEPGKPEDRLEFMTLYALANFNLHNFPKAIQICDSILQKFPHKAGILLLRGQAYQKIGEDEKAIKDYVSGVFLMGADSKSPITPSQTESEIGSLRLLESLLILGESNPVAEMAFADLWTSIDLGHSIEGTPGMLLTQIFLRHFQIERGKVFLFNTASPNSIDRSLRDLEAAVAARPSMKAAGPLRQRLIEAKEKGQSDELDTALLDIFCEKDNELSIQILVFLSHFQIIANFGNIAKKTTFTEKETRKIQNAERLLKAATEKEKNPDSAVAFLFWAGLAYSRGDMETAAHLVERAMELRKEWLDALFLKGKILRQQKKFQELKQLRREILQSFPNAGEMLEQLSEAGDFPEKTPVQTKNEN